LGLDITDAFNIKSDILSFGKIRASYTRVGKDADPYLLNSVYSVTSQGNNVSSISFPINGQAGFSIGTRIGSGDNLTPEFTTAYELGANIGLFKNRLNLDIAAYKTVSTDQILNVTVAATTGYRTRTTNIGQMSNKGIETMLSYKVFNNKDFSWTVTANYTVNRNNVDVIGAGVTAFNIPGSSFIGSAPSIVEGRPYGVILGNKRARTPDGTKFIVNPQTGLWVAAIANQEIANPNPDAIIGVTNTFNYKGIGLSFLFDSQQGGQLVSFTVASLKGAGALKETAVDREKPRIIDGVFLNADGSYTPNNIQIDAQNYFNQGLQTDLNVYGATAYRLREASLSYALPKNILSRTPFGAVSLSITGRNLFFLAPNSLIDPELSTQGAGNIRGLELQSSPNTRNYGVNLRLTF
jgi:outer membrane receptor protein involved in Fe transport